MASVFEQPEEFAKRLRAARAYADLSRKRLAAELGTSESDVRRWEEADETKRRLSPAQRRAHLVAVAEACGVPVRWLQEPFDAPLSERVEELQETVTALRQKIEERLSHLEELERHDAQLAQGELEQDLETTAQQSETSGSHTAESKRASANE